MKYSLLALALLGTWSVSAQAIDALAPIGGSTNSAVTVKTGDSKTTVAVTQDVAETKKGAEPDKINPFTGKNLSSEQKIRELESMKLQQQLMSEKLKLRKDEIEMMKLEQAAKKLLEPPVVEVKKKPDGFETTNTNKKTDAKKKTSPNLSQKGYIDDMSMAPIPKVKEPVAYFTPPANKNLNEPKLIGVLQVDERKVAVLSYNGVTIRVPEGGVVANKSISSVGNGKVMWGNTPLYTTGFVEGPRIIITDVATSAPGRSSPQQAQQPARPAAASAPAVTQGLPGSNAASPVFKLPPPPPPVSSK